MRGYFHVLCAFVITLVACSLRGDDQDVETEALFSEIANKLEVIVKKHQPEAEIVTDKYSIACRFHTQRYLVHSTLRDGTVTEGYSTPLGPGNDGFILKTQLAGGPWAGSLANPFGLRRMVYWTQFYHEVKLQSSRYYLTLEFAYGAKTKQEILRDLRRVLAEYERTGLAAAAVEIEPDIRNTDDWNACANRKK